MLVVVTGIAVSCTKMSDYVEKYQDEAEDNTHEVVFWTSTGLTINVYVSGSYEGQITRNYNSTPECGASGCVTYSTLSSSITYRAESDDGRYTWSETTKTLTIACKSVELRY